MDVNGEAIYGTSASPCNMPAWGRITQKGSHLYLHVFDWPADGELIVPVSAEAVECRLLAAPQREFEVTSSDAGLVVQLSGEAIGDIATVVDLEVAGEVASVEAKQ